MAETATCVMLGALQRLLDAIAGVDVNKRQCELLALMLRSILDCATRNGGEQLKTLESNSTAVIDIFNLIEAGIHLCEGFAAKSSDVVKIRSSLDTCTKFYALYERLALATQAISLRAVQLDHDIWRKAALEDTSDIEGLLLLMEHQHLTRSADVPLLSLEDVRSIQVDYAEANRPSTRMPTWTPAQSPVQTPTRQTLPGSPFEKTPSAFNPITLPSPHQLTPIAFRSSSTLQLGRFRGQAVVIKKVAISSKLSVARSYFLEDVPALRPLSHANIVTFLAYALDEKCGYVLMENFDGMSLSAALQRQPFHLSQVLGVAVQTAKGLSYLHGARPTVFHGKLTTNKIMLSRTLDRVKIVGFGYARAKNSAMLGGLVGHADSTELAFVAPEYFTGGLLGPKCDSYSFGSVLFTMTNRSPPFSNDRIGEDALIRRVLMRSRDTRPRTMPTCLWRLVQECWKHNLDDRPELNLIERQLLDLAATQLIFPEEPALREVYTDVDRATALFDSMLVPSEPLSPISPVVVAALRRRASLASSLPEFTLQTPSDDESEGATLRAITGHLDDPAAVEEHMLRLARECDNDTGLPLIATHDSIRIALAVLRAHADHDGIQLLGCRLMRIIGQELSPDQILPSLKSANIEPFLVAMSLQFVHCEGSSSRDSNGDLLSASDVELHNILSNLSTELRPLACIAHLGGIDAIVYAMKAHRACPQIQEEGCAIIASLAFHDEFLRVMPKAEAIELIIAAMRTHKIHPRVQENGCTALRNLSYDTETTEMVSCNMGGDALLSAMLAHRNNAYIQEQACYALSNLANNYIEAFDPVMASRAVDAILACMRTHKTTASVQIASFSFLRNLACELDHLTLIAKLGSIEVILSAMRSFKHDAALQEGGCALLGNLSCTSDAAYWAARGGVIVFMVDALLAAMSLFNENPQIQGAACIALGNIANMPDNAALVAKVGGVELVLNSMRAFLNNATVQEEGCLALRNLTRGVNVAVVGAAGGIAVVLAAMEAHKNNSRVQGEGCRALGLMARDTHNLGILMSLSGVQAIVSAMRAFKYDSSVQCRACWALLAIATQSRTSNVPGEIRALGGFSLAIAARQNFPQDNAIQLRARCLIWELS
eukprot:m.232969 g.232969  ORF g.232969 m.232969 type:complete len:1115 (+) comp12442_c0_seq1:360-3704(+)